MTKEEQEKEVREIIENLFKKGNEIVWAVNKCKICGHEWSTPTNVPKCNPLFEDICSKCKEKSEE